MTTEIKLQLIIFVNTKVSYSGDLCELYSKLNYEITIVDSFEKLKAAAFEKNIVGLCFVTTQPDLEILREFRVSYDFPVTIYYSDKHFSPKNITGLDKNKYFELWDANNINIIFEKQKKIYEEKAIFVEEFLMLRISFLEESKEIIENLEPLLLDVENNPNEIANYDKIFRLVHTVKGSSGVLENPQVTGFFHGFEDVINRIRKEPGKVTSHTVDLLLVSFDQMCKIISKYLENNEHELELSELTNTLTQFEFNNEIKGQSLPKPLAIKKTNPQKAATDSEDKNDGILVPAEILDQLLAQSGEITVIRNALKDVVGLLQKKFPCDQEIVTLINYLEEMNRINSAMQGQLTNQRNTPVSSAVRRLPRMVRDLAAQLNKKANLEVVGKNIRVDPKIAQILSMSMTHLIRNSMDHGIEVPEVRMKKGKIEAGNILISFSQDHENVYMSIKDDGNGIDPERVKNKLIENGAMSKEEVNSLSVGKLLNQIFEPGFSTAEKLTDVSGRGVGMDMVKTGIEKLGGYISVTSVLGQGSEFKTVFPIPKSESIINGLVIEMEEHKFVIPQEFILRLISLRVEDLTQFVKTVQGFDVLYDGEEVLPIIKLEDQINCKLQITTNRQDFVILGIEGYKIALRVGGILDIEDLVQKQIPQSILKTDLYKGATLLGDGRVGLIIDCKKLVKSFNIEKQASDNSKEQKQSTKNIDFDYLLAAIDEKREVIAFKLEEVYRLEEIKLSQLVYSHDGFSMAYHDTIAKVIDLNQLMYNKPKQFKEDFCSALVFKRFDKFYLLLVDEVISIISSEGVELTEIAGNEFSKIMMQIDKKIRNIIDIERILQSTKTYKNALKIEASKVA